MPKHKAEAEHRAFAKGQRREMTRAEAMIWQAVRGGRLDGNKFKREVPFGRYVADFSCAAAGLIVEVDGRTHDNATRVLKDAERDRWFAAQGFRVLRLPDERVLGSPGFVTEQIRQALACPAPSPASLRSAPSPSGGEGKGAP